MSKVEREAPDAVNCGRAAAGGLASFEPTQAHHIETDQFFCLTRKADIEGKQNGRAYTVHTFGAKSCDCELRDITIGRVCTATREIATSTRHLK